MPDSENSLDFLIRTKADGTGIEETKAGLEDLTNTGKGLATNLPDLSAKTNQFQIATESEYKVVQKAHEALGEKIRLMQAAGKDTAALVTAQNALSESLSTERALQLATTIETRAANNAKLQQAIADNAAAAAALENAAAHKVLEGAVHGNAGAMREAFVIGRELERGNYSRMAGSISILAGRMGLLEVALGAINPVTATAAAGLLGFDLVIKSTVDHQKLLAASTEDLTRILGGMDDLSNTLETLDKYRASASDAADSTDRLADATKALQENTSGALEAQQRMAQYAREEAEARERLAIAKIRERVASGEISGAAGAVAEAAARGGSAAAVAAAQSKAEQGEIDTLTGQRKGEQGILSGLEDKKDPGLEKKHAADYAAEGAQTEVDTATKNVKEADDFWTKNFRSMTLDERDEYKAHMVQLRMLRDQAQDELEKRKAAAKAEDDAYDDIIKGIKEAKAKLDELNRQIDTKTTAHEQADGSRKTITDIDRQTADAEQDAVIEKALAAMDKAANSGQTTQLIKGLTDMLGGTQDDILTILAIVHYHEEKHTTVAQELAALKNFVERNKNNADNQ